MLLDWKCSHLNCWGPWGFVLGGMDPWGTGSRLSEDMPLSSILANETQTPLAARVLQNDYPQRNNPHHNIKLIC